MNPARRLVGDCIAVWRAADCKSAFKWSVGLAIHFPEIARKRSLVPADLAVEGCSCSFSVNGVTVELPGSLFSAAREMYCRRVYWPSAGFLPRPGWRVADFGSNIGLFSLYAAKAGARVIAVEAQSRLVDRSEHLLASSGVRSHITLIHALLGGGHTGVLAGAGAPLGPDWERQPNAIGVAEAFDAAGFGRVDLVKIDIEGGEYDLIGEASGWLPRVDRITMEVHADHGDPEGVAQLLTSYGFTVQRATSDLERVESLTRSGYLYARRLEGRLSR